MGIEQFDYLYLKAQELLGYFNSINTKITAISPAVSSLNTSFTAIQTTLTSTETGIDAIQAAISNANYSSADSMLTDTKTTISGLKISIGSTGIPSFQDISDMQAALVSATELVNSLIPMITTEIEKICGNGTTWYIYKCAACSLHCEEKYKFVPPDPNVLKYCKLKADDSANYTQDHMEGGN